VSVDDHDSSSARFDAQLKCQTCKLAYSPISVATFRNSGRVKDPAQEIHFFILLSFSANSPASTSTGTRHAGACARTGCTCAHTISVLMGRFS
jgi:hypothetical protein